jgi:hypothetical protein
MRWSSKTRNIFAAISLALGLGILAFAFWQRLLVSALLGMAGAFGVEGEADYDIVSLLAPYVGAALLLSGIALIILPRLRRG